MWERMMKVNKALSKWLGCLKSLTATTSSREIPANTLAALRLMKSVAMAVASIGVYWAITPFVFILLIKYSFFLVEIGELAATACKWIGTTANWKQTSKLDSNAIECRKKGLKGVQQPVDRRGRSIHPRLYHFFLKSYYSLLKKVILLKALFA